MGCDQPRFPAPSHSSYDVDFFHFIPNRYIIGGCQFQIKDDQYLDKMECYESSANSCDIDLTDDEIEDSKKNPTDFDQSMNINVVSWLISNQIDR